MFSFQNQLHQSFSHVDAHSVHHYLFFEENYLKGWWTRDVIFSHHLWQKLCLFEGVPLLTPFGSLLVGFLGEYLPLFSLKNSKFRSAARKAVFLGGGELKSWQRRALRKRGT